MLNVVTNDITLVPKWLSPNENDPINRGNVVFQIEPFATPLWGRGRKAGWSALSHFGRVRSYGFDSGILTQAANFDRYGAYAPDLPDDPGLCLHPLQARVRGASLGWGEWASRKVVISPGGLAHDDKACKWRILYLGRRYPLRDFRSFCSACRQVF